MPNTRIFAYISGPMSGYPEHNFPAFRECADRLRRWTDWTIISPVELDLNANYEPGSLSWEDYLRADLREVLECNAIVRLPGWQQSKGALLELHVAQMIGCQVWDYLPLVERKEGLVLVRTDFSQALSAVV